MSHCTRARTVHIKSINLLNRDILLIDDKAVDEIILNIKKYDRVYEG